MMINKLIRSKLKLEEARVPSSLHDYGNTSSASIPVSLVHQVRDAFMKPGTRFVFCGFGIGLSWASLLIETSADTYCSEIIEV
jgi:3-oxoacyl-[acyl-carrier-protein] synthase-3